MFVGLVFKHISEPWGGFHKTVCALRHAQNVCFFALLAILRQSVFHKEKSQNIRPAPIVFTPCALRPQKASQKLGVERKMILPSKN